MRKFVCQSPSPCSRLLHHGGFRPAAAAAARSGTPEEQAACNRDVQRHCRSVINQGDFTILACLQQNRAQISAACNQVLKNHGQ